MIPSLILPELRGRSDFHPGPLLATYFYRFNVTRPPFNDVRVRRAFALAIDKEVITERITRGNEPVAQSLTPRGVADYLPPEGLPPDPETARGLLKSAGFPDGHGFPRISLLYNKSELNEQITRANEHMVRDLNAAAKVQRSLLPDTSVTLPGAQVSWRYVPCQGLAGDFLNVFPLDDEHAGLFVVDVSGHGVPSSLMAVTVGRFLTPKVTDQSLLVRQGADGRIAIARPAEVATQLNRLFQADEFSGLYFTILYGVLHLPSGRLDYVSGGHPAMVRVPAGGTPEFHGAEGFPIAFVPDIEYEQHTLQLAPGDRLYFYSDGVTEAMDKERQPLGDDAMAAVLGAGRTASLDESVKSLLDRVEHWCQPNGPLDDVSILGVEWRP
jgi:sigma-B regulation protein RsbU (phosphoserine phosphatase)